MNLPGRVLLIEGDELVSKACEVCLRHVGLDVTAASDGEAGLRLARTKPYADLVVLDLSTSKVPGLDVLRALKEDPSTADIPVMILSNSPREDEKDVALKLGAAGYYVRPNLSLRALALEADQLIARRPASS